jgi:hypothetical protein
MRKKISPALNTYHRTDPSVAAREEMQSYCLAHPGSPSAVRRPQLSTRGDLWIALLGPNVEKGIVGIGPTVDAALRAFDAQYGRDENSRSSSFTRLIAAHRSLFLGYVTVFSYFS